MNLRKSDLFDGKITAVRIIVAYLFAKFSLEFAYNFFDASTGAAFTIELVPLAVFYLLIVAFIFPNKLPLRSIVWGDLYTKKIELNIANVLLVIIFGIVFRYGVLILQIIYDNAFNIDLQGHIDEMRLVASNGISEYINLSLLSKVTISPMIEEFVYRGCLLGYLLSRYNASRAILLSAIIFGVFHGIGGFSSAFLGGILFAAIYIVFRNLFLSFAVHGAVNLFISLSSGLIVKITPFSLTDLQQNPMLAISLLPGLMVIVFVVIILVCFWNKRVESPFPITMIKEYQK